MKDLKRAIGFVSNKQEEDQDDQLQRYVNLKLAANNLPLSESNKDIHFFSSASDLIKKVRARAQLLKKYQCPIDQRIQNFINDHLSDVCKPDSIRLPNKSIDLDRHGLARAMSFPPNKDSLITNHLYSYKIEQGVLHNPASDRRTTVGVFHVAEGGLPVPMDKKSVPKAVFANLLAEALKPPKDLLRLPYTSNQKNKAECFVSLMIRPLVCPEIPGIAPRKRMEIRFFVPGSLVSNLDFVESIFGNAGDPHLPENDSGLDIEQFSGHTGLVLLAPHIKTLKKKDLGLPNIKQATPRQIRDGMCWKSPNELYNNGDSFKITCRTEDGVILTILTDNYFGYCKKEVKTQISFAANLLGLAEEEHAGGAIAFANKRLPAVFKESNFRIYSQDKNIAYSFADLKKKYKTFIDFQVDGYGIDKNFPSIIYVPEDTEFDIVKQTVTWQLNSAVKTLKLLPSKVYMYPSGFKVRMEQHPSGTYWRLIGTRAEGTLIHKPATVSGGGKSEISKSIDYSVIYKSFFIKDIKKDLAAAEEIITKDYSKRFKDKKDFDKQKEKRPFLGKERSLGSIIKLLTPSEVYTPQYNKWLRSIPNHIRSLVFIIKHHQETLGSDWKAHFSVDKLDGLGGNELKMNRRLVSSYLRIGVDAEKDWRIFQLRPDYVASDKLQIEDDITASVVVPNKILRHTGKDANAYVKIVENCEYRFFQRPDDAVVRGFDIQAESDLAGKNNFISNYEPLTSKDACNIRDSVVDFVKFTKPMKDLIEKAASQSADKYFICSAYPRIVDGKPTKNVRYLQTRQDLVAPIHKYIGEMGVRLQRKVPADENPIMVVNNVLPGRRLNPTEPGVRNLAVYNPIHYQELPELFMDYISSLTGKSPSTTGAGSEGALTKGPFNALLATADLNNTLVSYILTGYDGFTTAANYVGKIKVDHDISLLIPEILCRMTKEEKNAVKLIEDGCLEKINDFKYKGKTVLSSRLGYRINEKFAQLYLGRIFNNPIAVFNQEFLKPETQGMADFVDGINNIVESHKQIAQNYIDDGSIEEACPPLKALLMIMANGSYEGLTVHSKEFRKMFTLESMLASDWYNERLLVKQQKDIRLWNRHIAYLQENMERYSGSEMSEELSLKQKLETAIKMKKKVQSLAYLKSLEGTIGADPLGQF